METHYVLQHLDHLPDGCTVPTGRAKPWGTGHAVMCCREYIDAPFAAINGDDFYGRDAFQQIYDFLSQPHKPGEYAMTGFLLKNTLSENGSVSRGVCHASPEGYLESIVENTHIISTCDGPLTTTDGETYRLLSPDTPVSMNLWAFTPDFMDQLWARFPAFYQNAMAANPLKGEYYLPFVVNDTLRDGESAVRMLHTTSKWYGITYQPDLPAVREALAKLTQEGEYPEALWEK